MTLTSAHPGRSRRIKRSHIVRQLWQPSDSEDDLEQDSRLSDTADSESSWSDSAASNDGASEVVEEEEEGEAKEEGSSSAEKYLAGVAAWLEAECKEVLTGVDWEQEFEHLQNDDILVEGMNTSALQRIRRGHGPRPSKFEDLLAPLRLTDSGRAPQFSKRPIKETCESMEATLRAWNKHVADAASDNTGARKILMKALHSRINMLNKALITRWSADAHDNTCRRLLNAIHAYRPEAVSFENQDPMGLLIIIIAHLGYAIPDIDDELKHLMLYTLVKERGYSAHVANENTRRRYEDKIEDAKRQGDAPEAAKNKAKLKAWVSAGLQKNCDVIIERIKTARQNLRLKGLEDIQELCVLQTAQKLVLSDRIRDGKSPSELLVPRSAWWSERAAARDAADAKLTELISEYIDDLEASCKVIARAIDDMKDVNKTRVVTRAFKFAGLDLKNVTEDERHSIVQERMLNPGTVAMMTDAIKGVSEINANAEGTGESAGKMDRKMEEMLKAVTEVHYEYDALSKLVNSDPHMELGGA